jgi:hypothetical protein
MRRMRFTSQRAAAMPESVFATMDRAKAEARARGIDIIDLSIGSSDLSPPAEVLEALRAATRDAATYRYPLHSDTAELRRSAAEHLARRFGVRVDAEREVLPLIGAQEGLAHLLQAVADPGDGLLLPDPGYPPYLGAAALAGLAVHPLPLLAERGFLPDLSAVPAEVRRGARVLLLNYPSNPTSAVAPRSLFAEAVAFCREHGLLFVHDHPYAELTFGDYRAPSALEVAGASDVTVELHSLSKSFHLGGFRVGFAAGNAQALAALARVKGAVDFHQYLGIQRAAALALRLPEAVVRAGALTFEARRDALVAALRAAGWSVDLPQASMYVWARLPQGAGRSLDFAVRLARETGVALAPGAAFGARGEGYVRFALVREPEALRQAVARLQAFTR